MWRWTALVVLAVLHKNVSSQPITENSNDDRLTTHLDLEESCSCEDFEKSSIRRDVRYDDPIDADSEDMVFTRTRDMDDCACRFRYTDSQGASSLLFPTAMRSAETNLRPGEKKELKPLFNPEVDLASSVLEQLRVATDEEYEEALARDAAKTATRAVEGIVFGDATPQESANIVTIVVNPKASDNEDVIQQVSDTKQSRCIRPLERASSLSFSDRLKLSTKRPYYRNLQELDSEVGASTIDEQKISATSPLEHKDLKSSITSDDIEDNCNGSDLRSTSEDPYQNKLKKYDKASSPLLQSIKDRLHSLSRIPKSKLKPLLPEAVKTTNDLSPAPSIVYEQATEKVPYERTNSQLESIKQQIKPLSITNLLNLKDVELIPIKDLFSKQAKKSNYLKSGKLLPSMFEQHHGEISTENKNDVAEDRKTTSLTLRNDPIEKVISEPKSSSSILNLKITPVKTSINSDNCKNEKELIELNREAHRNDYNKPKEVLSSILQNNDDEFSIQNDEQESDSGTTLYTEVNGLATDNDPEPSPSLMNFQVAPEETLKINDGCDSVGVTKEADTEIGEEEPRSTEILDTIPVVNDILPKATFDSQNDCLENNNRQDLITDVGNTDSNTIDQLESQSSEIQNVEPDYYKPKSIEGDDESKMTKVPRPKLLDSIAIDKTISNIKSYILKKKEDLNKIKTSIKNRNIPNQESEDKSVTRNINEDCTNEASILISTVNPTEINENFEVFTTTKLNLADGRLEDISTTKLPNVSNDNTQDTCVSAEISMQDLQKLSDSILQQEERQSTNVECNKSLNEEEVDSSQNNSEDTDLLDSDSSASTPTQAVMEPENLENMQNKSEVINAVCKTESPSQTDVSEMNINTIPKGSETIGMHSIFNQPIKPSLDLLKNPLKDINNVLKLPPLDPLKDKFTKFFYKSERNTEDTFPLAVKSKPLNILNPLKTTDLSSPNFPLQTPLLRLSEDREFDNLEETRRSSLLPTTPIVDLQSYETESSVLRGLQFKPVNLKPTLEENKASEKYLKASSNLNDHLNPLNDLRSQVTDSSVEASNNIYSSLKNTQNAVESKLREIKNDNMNLFKTPIKSSSTLLDTLSQNHEDMNDKLRALHEDFNDRVESMRNDLIDSSKRLTSGYHDPKLSLKSSRVFNKPDYDNINHKLRALRINFTDRIESMRNDIIDRSKPLTDRWRSTGSNFRSSSNFNKQNKPNIPLKKTWKASNGRDSQLSSTRKQTPLRTSLASKALEQKKLRMPASASVPVPRFVQVPELNPNLSKLPPTLRKVSPLTPNYNKNVDEDVSRSFGGQGSTFQLPSPLRNRINLKKENTVTVSFSTTPRPEKVNIPNFRSITQQNTGLGRTNFETRPIYEDRNGSPSILKNSKPSVLNYDQPHKYRYLNGEENEKLLTNPIGLKEKNQLKVSKTALQSWPKATESAFLSKVKDAVRERLSYLNSARALKQSMQVDKAKDIRELSVLKSDMARSASENKEIVHKHMLKENVSYNCKMVCTKD